MNEVVVYLGFGSALIGFVAVFVNIGVLKGKFRIYGQSRYFIPVYQRYA